MSRKPKSISSVEPTAEPTTKAPVIEPDMPDLPDKPAEAAPASVLVSSAITGEAIPSGVIHSKTKFWWGKWSHKTDPNDNAKVWLEVNGEPLTWQRGVRTIVPEPYLHAARHCTYRQYSQKPGEGRREATIIQRFTFDKECEATLEEFRKLFETGTKLTQELVNRFGTNIPPQKQALPSLPGAED